jgi:Arc/MetJ-type ribon-helix-helix transcriptional regulator
VCVGFVTLFDVGDGSEYGIIDKLKEISSMPYSFPPEVQRLVETRMASGKYASEDELLRDALEALAAESEELQAIQDALAEWRGGDRGVPLKDGFDIVRHRGNGRAGE